MTTPRETPEQKAPVDKFVLFLGALLLLGLIFLAGTRNLFSGLVLAPPPVVGEWKGDRVPWRIELHPDKTVASVSADDSTDTAQPRASIPGTYSIDFFGTLWINLNNGKSYTAQLRTDMPNRFDLIESTTGVVTVFERVRQ